MCTVSLHSMYNGCLSVDASCNSFLCQVSRKFSDVAFWYPSHSLLPKFEVVNDSESKFSNSSLITAEYGANTPLGMSVEYVVSYRKGSPLISEAASQVLLNS